MNHLEYPWAVNKTKLAASVMDLKEKLKTDHRFEITEETVKAEYIKHGGLIREKEVEEEVITEEKAPKAPKISKK